jgi:hypothetical protein
MEEAIYRNLFFIMGTISLIFFSISWLRDPGYLRNFKKRFEPLEFLVLKIHVS